MRKIKWVKRVKRVKPPVRKRIEPSPMTILWHLHGGTSTAPALNGKEEVVHQHESENSREWEKRGEYAPPPLQD